MYCRNLLVIVFYAGIKLIFAQSGDSDSTALLDDPASYIAADDSDAFHADPRTPTPIPVEHNANPFDNLPPAPIPGLGMGMFGITVYEIPPSQSEFLSRAAVAMLHMIKAETEDLLKLKYAVESQTHEGNIKYNLQIRLYKILFNVQQLFCPYYHCEFGSCGVRNLDEINPTPIPKVEQEMVSVWNGLLAQPRMFFGVSNDKLPVPETDTSEGDENIHRLILEGVLGVRHPTIGNGLGSFIFSPTEINFLERLSAHLNSVHYGDKIRVPSFFGIYVHCVCWDGFVGEKCELCIMKDNSLSLGAIGRDNWALEREEFERERVLLVNMFTENK